MLELQTKIKRQIEIVGLIADTEACYKAADLAHLFNCEELTIKRDLQELRSAGISIHSESKRGIRITSPIDPKLLTELVLQYVGLCYSQNNIDKTASLVVRKKKIGALHDIVHLQRSIEMKTTVIIDYEKEKDQAEKERELAPLLIFQSEGLYRLLALHDGRIKQYHINKIRSIRVTTNKFKPIPAAEIEKMFRYSWRSWIGSERHTVKIFFEKGLVGWYNPHHLMDMESIEEQEDGSAIATVTVNSLPEIASWIASKGKGVKVLEPKELKEKIIEIGRGILGNY